jgi:hypothetical protein
MTAVGASAYRLLGYRADSPTLHILRERMLLEPPSFAAMRDDPQRLHTLYYWYQAARPWIAQRCALLRDGAPIGALTVTAVFDHASTAVDAR